MKYLQTSHIEIQKSGRRDDYLRRGVAFLGAPRKHPYDPEKIILVVNPFSRETDFYELRLQDILHVEERSNLVSEDGESVQIAEIWVLRGGLAVKFEPFVVGTSSVAGRAVWDREARNPR